MITQLARPPRRFDRNVRLPTVAAPRRPPEIPTGTYLELIHQQLPTGADPRQYRQGWEAALASSTRYSGTDVKITEHLIVRDGKLVRSEVVVDASGSGADCQCCTQIPHAVHGMPIMHSVEMPRSAGCSHPKDLGVRRSQSERVVSRRAVAGGEVGDNEPRT